MNLRIKHSAVGSFPQGEIVPADAFEGGNSEIARLMACGAVEPVDAAPTLIPPVAFSLVNEMDDDELVNENRRLSDMVSGLRSRILDTDSQLRDARADNGGETRRDLESVTKKYELLELENARLQVQIESLATLAESTTGGPPAEASQEPVSPTTEPKIPAPAPAKTKKK